MLTAKEILQLYPYILVYFRFHPSHSISSFSCDFFFLGEHCLPFTFVTMPNFLLVLGLFASSCGQRTCFQLFHPFRVTAACVIGSMTSVWEIIPCTWDECVVSCSKVEFPTLPAYFSVFANALGQKLFYSVVYALSLPPLPSPRVLLCSPFWPSHLSLPGAGITDLKHQDDFSHI